jgi:hypothetical protein
MSENYVPSFCSAGKIKSSLWPPNEAQPASREASDARPPAPAWLRRFGQFARCSATSGVASHVPGGSYRRLSTRRPPVIITCVEFEKSGLGRRSCTAASNNSSNRRENWGTLNSPASISAAAMQRVTSRCIRHERAAAGQEDDPNLLANMRLDFVGARGCSILYHEKKNGQPPLLADSPCCSGRATTCPMSCLLRSTSQEPRRLCSIPRKLKDESFFS